MGVLFFLIVVTLVPFAVGPDLAQLRRIGPAILWVGALLASLLTLDRLLAADHEDGSLDLLLMGTTPLELVVLPKAAAHWITSRLPLVIATPPPPPWCSRLRWLACSSISNRSRSARSRFPCLPARRR